MKKYMPMTLLALLPVAYVGAAEPVNPQPTLPTFQAPATAPQPTPPTGATDKAPLPAALPQFEAPFTAPPPPQQQPPSLQIEWGDLALFFYISNPRMERQVTTDILGSASVNTVFAFHVQAHRSFSNVTTFVANFLDANGYKASFMPVDFKPLPYQWEPGVQAEASVLLLEDLANIRTIQFGTLF